MAINKPFPDIAALIEAGELAITDKVIADVKNGVSFWVDINSEQVIPEKIYKTISGKYLIIARHETNEEKEARKIAREQEAAEIKKARRARIASDMAKPGYILIAYHNPFKADENTFSQRFPEAHAYYMPEKGARYVYQFIFEYTDAVQQKYTSIYTAKPAKCSQPHGSRWSRKEVADTIKQRRDEFVLCAPLWLLTSIPDPRPRYLHPGNEEREGEPSGAFIPA